MHWILQDNLFNEEAYGVLLETLERFGIPHSVHKVIPFIGELTPEPETNGQRVICMGSYSLRHAARKRGWFPGVFDLEPFDFLEQRKHWGPHLLNHDAAVTAFQEVVFTEDVMFVRPVKDSKCFAGTLFGKAEFEAWQQKVVADEGYDGSSLTRETLVQTVRPKEIWAEYRFWIVKGRIVTKSLYKRGLRVISSREVDERFSDYVAARLQEWQPHEAFVLDVCDTPEGIRIVEINTLNSSGFYAADLSSLVLALEEAYG